LKGKAFSDKENSMSVKMFADCYMGYMLNPGLHSSRDKQVCPNAGLGKRHRVFTLMYMFIMFLLCGLILSLIANELKAIDYEVEGNVSKRIYLNGDIKSIIERRSILK
jgi:hypothetical protein